VANHRTLAERSVRTWKNHFIASWATADVACPPPLWATTVEHCELTLNLCRPSYRNLYLSMAGLHKQRYPFHSRPWAPWDVRFRCSSLQGRPPGQRTLRKGSTSAPLLTATSSTVSGSHRGLSVQCRHWLAALAGHSLSYPTAVGVCNQRARSYHGRQCCG
jgi:hypothetical protein